MGVQVCAPSFIRPAALWCASGATPYLVMARMQSPKELFPLASAKLYIILFIYQKSFFLSFPKCLSCLWTEYFPGCRSTVPALAAVPMPIAGI